jgi:hypothetical protein
MRKTMIILLLTPLFVFSQNFVKTWQHCYGGSDDDQVRSTIPYNNGYLFFGYTESTDGDISYNPNPETRTAWLVNIDNKGNIIFDTCYNEGYNYTYGRKIFYNDSILYLTGTAGPNNQGGIQGYWLAQIDSNFNLTWQDVLGGSYVEDPRGGCIAHDGGIIVSGITGSPDGDIEEYYGTFDNWLVKLNADGSRDWVKTYGNVGAEEGGNIIPTSDGGYIYACSGYNQLPGNTYCEGHDGQMAEAWLIKLDANGEKEWHRCYGGSYNDLLRQIIELDDGYIISGFTRSADGDINNFHGIAGEAYDGWLLKTDFNGDIIWSKCYGGTYDDNLGRIFINEDNSFTIIGATESHNGDVQGNTAPNRKSVLWLIKIDGNGNLLYQKPFDDEPYLQGGGDVKVSDYKYVIATTKNDFGCNYSWNNHNDDIYVYEIQDMDEFIPSQPVGAESVCLGIETESIYTTDLVVDTMETQWLLEPEEAGIITEMHESALIHWNLEFNDTAWLKVRSVNKYGESSYSVAKEIIVYPALNLLDINGPDSICSNNHSIFTIPNPQAYHLNWQLSPPGAGNISSQQDTAYINWNSQFAGMVALRANSSNSCTQIEYSPVKSILVKTCTGLSEQSYHSLQVYPNPAQTSLTFELPTITKESILQIKDIYGKSIAKLPLNKGQSKLYWNCRNVAPGVYFYQAEIGAHDGYREVYRGKVVIQK